MFSHDTIENQRNRVNIDDLDYGVAREMLRFIYTAKVRNLTNLADRLLEAADKVQFRIIVLKFLCIP